MLQIDDLMKSTGYLKLIGVMKLRINWNVCTIKLLLFVLVKCLGMGSVNWRYMNEQDCKK